MKFAIVLMILIALAGCAANLDQGACGAGYVEGVIGCIKPAQAFAFPG